MGLQAAIDKAAAQRKQSAAIALSKGMKTMGSIGKAGLSLGDDGIRMEELECSKS